jgi:hypothetical protein
MIEEDMQFSEFVNQMHNLYGFWADDEDADLLLNKFIHFALTGQLMSVNNHPEDSTQYTILFDHNEHLDPGIESVRDYDSLIGFSNNLPYWVPLSLHLIPQAIHQLKRTLHAYVDRTLVEPIMVCMYSVSNISQTNIPLL